MNFKRSIMLGAGLLACLALPVTAGIWSNFPTVGVAAHCASTNQANTTVPTGSTNCTTTIPAGPTSVTGAETVPADTNAAGGAAPQTVNLSMANLNALPVTVQAGSITANNNLSPTSAIGGYILTAASTLSPTNASFPPNPVDGQQFSLSATANITTLQMAGSIAGTGGADTVSNPPTSLTVSTTGPYGYQFKYNLAARKWYRLQ